MGRPFSKSESAQALDRDEGLLASSEQMKITSITRHLA